MNRVVVTGLGVISSIAADLPSYLEALRRGESGMRTIESFDTSGYRVDFAGEIKGFDLEARRLARLQELDRSVQLGVAVSYEALADAGLRITEALAKRMGVAIGTSLGGTLSLDKHIEQERALSAEESDPALVLAIPQSTTAGFIAKEFGLLGPLSTVATACAAGTNSIGYAFDVIRHGEADVMLAGGVDPLSRLSFSGFGTLKSLTRSKVRPFDRDRDGLALGEAASVVVLERLDHALERGAPIYAEVLGYGLSNDAYHATSPDPNGGGAIRSMRQALEQAGLRPEQVDYINAHGTSTPYNDQMEAIAIKAVFGDQAESIPISSTKSMIGHTLGTAGSIEFLTCALALQHQFLPPTINFENPIADFEFDFVPNVSRPAAIEVALSNSFAFAGNTASIVLRRYSQG